MKLHRSQEKGFEFECCLVTPGLSKDIGVKYDDALFYLQIARSDIRPHVMWIVSLVEITS